MLIHSNPTWPEFTIRKQSSSQLPKHATKINFFLTTLPDMIILRICFTTNHIRRCEKWPTSLRVCRVKHCSRHRLQTTIVTSIIITTQCLCTYLTALRIADGVPCISEVWCKALDIF